MSVNVRYKLSNALDVLTRSFATFSFVLFAGSLPIFTIAYIRRYRGVKQAIQKHEHNSGDNSRVKVIK